jgi:hypothetical protein
MSKKYIIICNEDNSFTIENGDYNKVQTEVKDMVSFCLQYLYTILNTNEITLSESAKLKVIDVINSFEFDENDVEQLSLLITKMGYKLDKVMMTYENGIPKSWEDEI